ncbi:twin-arginine translocase subunit TatC [Clostridium polynesiense]|uniref:twin-arginine translocase subunit TatC n=1 Tax=Clostridium polynesiense TaxID=1325933 RepID=UPI000A40D3C2|nr:twin-arginine translocase subunit TatC [Clostridium polynesiense]
MKKVKKDKNTLVGHLAELRKRLIICAAALIVLSSVSYMYIKPVVMEILKPAGKYEFIYLTPSELFLSYIKLSLIAGTTLAAPIIFLEIWIFIKPALKKEEKRYIFLSLMGGSLLFLIGVTFAYKVVIPFTLEFFSNMNIDEVKPMISFQSYIGFITTLILCFGIVFELPILMILLTQFGILKVRFLKKNRKYIILIVFIIAAIITPPDIISQVLIAGPMLLLFEFGVVLSKIIEKKKNRGNTALRS